MDREYVYHEPTTGICPECLKRIPAKIILKDDKVFLKKSCMVHGEQEELLEEDIDYHLSKRDLDKPGTISETQTRARKGCPFDCGLCPEHDQHTCIGLIEITSDCNLGCPVCYASSSAHKNIAVSKISEMLDFFIESEGGEAEILQVSGGEPTTHPDILEIIELARTKNIRYVMLNTNGIRIAEDEEFVSQLGKFKGRFEVYLQFDGFGSEVYHHLRGKDLSEMKHKAIENLVKHDVPTTLVATIEKGINDNQIGKIIRFGMETRCIRGINFQPTAYYGRLKKPDTKQRITLSGIIRQIENQLPDTFQRGDIIPLPCNVERVAVTFMAKAGKGKFLPITRDIRIKNYLPLIDNTFAFDADKILKNKAKSVITDTGCCSCMRFVNDIKRILPSGFALRSKQEKLRYINENTFRISITSFVDAYNFDMKSMQKECVHVITPELKKIPFSAYNMFYRR